MRVLEHMVSVNVLFTLLFVIYCMLLRGETYFLANRIWLIGSALLSLITPLVPRPSGLMDLPVFVLPTVVTNAELGAGGFQFQWVDLLLVAYSVGVVVQLYRLAMDARAAWSCSGSAGDEASSFLWRYVVPSRLQGVDREAMIIHERAHVRNGHSADVLLFRIVQAFNWFVPIWGLALRELQLVHEYTADAEAKEHHNDYDSLLLAEAIGLPRFTLTNSFRSSNLRTRIMMMHRSPSKKTVRIKYVVAAASLAFLLASASPIRSAVPFHGAQNEVLKKAEKMPEFPGGMDGLVKFLQANINYPASGNKAVKEGGNGPTGTVHVQFVVKQDGVVDKVVVLKGYSPALDAEAIRVVKAMPKWEPGMNDGKPVAVEMVLPIRFAHD